MQLSIILTSILLPLGILASPVAEAAEVSLNERGPIRRPQTCAIVGGASSVNCRNGPGTKWDVKTKLRKGRSYNFWCVWPGGECVTINGKRNCGWHYVRDLDCFVNGHYTSNACTLAGLGSCKGCDDCVANPF